MVLNNPAARLHVILGKVRGMGPATKAADAWRGILQEGGPQDQLRFLHRFGRVMGLPLLVKNEISQLRDIDHEMYLRWVPQVEQAFFAQNLSGTIADMVNRIDQNVLDRIEFCADALARQRPESMVDAKDLAEIRKEVEDLRRDVKVADIEVALKEYLCSQLDEVFSAIQDYDVFGILPIRRAVQTAVGAVVLNQERARMAAETSIGERVWKVMARLLLITSLTNSVLQITGRVEDLIAPAKAASTQAPSPSHSDQSRPGIDVTSALNSKPHSETTQA